MKKILVKTIAFLFIVGGLVAVLWPVDTWRLYDANWQPLAMTEAENFCAGKILAESGFANKPNNPAVDECVENSDKGDTPSVGSSQHWFCQGINSAMALTDCHAQLTTYRVWALQHGGYTFTWNDTNAYPEIIQYDISKAPRGDGRNDDNRNESGRGFGGP